MCRLSGSAGTLPDVSSCLYLPFSRILLVLRYKLFDSLAGLIPMYFLLLHSYLPQAIVQDPLELQILLSSLPKC